MCIRDSPRPERPRSREPRKPAEPRHVGRTDGDVRAAPSTRRFRHDPAARAASSCVTSWLTTFPSARPRVFGEIQPMTLPCLLYTSDAADDLTRVDLGGRRLIK